MGRKKLIHYHSSDVNVKPHGLSLGEIGVVHVSSDPGKSLLYVETVSGSSNANTLAVFATKSYIDSATTNTLGFIGSLADMAVTNITINDTEYSGNTVDLGDFLSANTEYVKSISQTTTTSAVTTTFTMQDGTTTYTVHEPKIIDCGTY